MFYFKELCPLVFSSGPCHRGEEKRRSWRFLAKRGLVFIGELIFFKHNRTSCLSLASKSSQIFASRPCSHKVSLCIIKIIMRLSWSSSLSLVCDLAFSSFLCVTFESEIFFLPLQDFGEEPSVDDSPHGHRERPAGCAYGNCDEPCSDRWIFEVEKREGQWTVRSRLHVPVWIVRRAGRREGGRREFAVFVLYFLHGDMVYLTWIMTEHQAWFIPGSPLPTISFSFAHLDLSDTAVSHFFSRIWRFNVDPLKYSLSVRISLSLFDGHSLILTHPLFSGPAMSKAISNTMKACAVKSDSESF